MRYANPLCAALCAMALSATSATAGDPVGRPVTATLIEGWQQADGTRIAAVHLQMAPGWKTYWRAPGDAGIPPSFSWKGSRNIGAVAVNWPTPRVFDQNGMRSVGYADQVILPLSISPRQAGQPVEVNLTLDIGVCHDICVPERLRLSGRLEGGAAVPVPAIAAALAERPYTASEAGAARPTCTLRPTEDGLQVTATLRMPSTGGPEHVVIEAGRADVWVSEATTARQGGTLTAEAELVASGSGPLSIDRSALRFTVLGSSYGVDIRGCDAG